MSNDVDFTLLAMGKHEALAQLQKFLVTGITEDPSSLYGDYSLEPLVLFPTTDCGHKWLGIESQKERWWEGLCVDDCFLFTVDDRTAIQSAIANVSNGSSEKLSASEIIEMVISMPSERATELKEVSHKWFSGQVLDRLLVRGACLNDLPHQFVCHVSEKFPEIEFELWGTIEHLEYERWRFKGGEATLLERCLNEVVC